MEPPSTTIAPVGQAERLQAAVAAQRFPMVAEAHFPEISHFRNSFSLFKSPNFIANHFLMREMDSRDALPPSLLKFYPLPAAVGAPQGDTLDALTAKSLPEAAGGAVTSSSANTAAQGGGGQV